MTPWAGDPRVYEIREEIREAARSSLLDLESYRKNGGDAFSSVHKLYDALGHQKDFFEDTIYVLHWWYLVRKNSDKQMRYLEEVALEIAILRQDIGEFFRPEYRAGMSDDRLAYFRGLLRELSNF
jgi:hypothetical protein